MTEEKKEEVKAEPKQDKLHVGLSKMDMNELVQGIAVKKGNITVTYEPLSE